jgi:hypothetical protein
LGGDQTRVQEVQGGRNSSTSSKKNRKKKGEGGREGRGGTHDGGKSDAAFHIFDLFECVLEIVLPIAIIWE